MFRGVDKCFEDDSDDDNHTIISVLGEEKKASIVGYGKLVFPFSDNYLTAPKFYLLDNI